MTGLIRVFIFCTILLFLSALNSGSALCQSPAAESNQPQMTPDTQLGQQSGARTGGQMQQGPGGQQGQGSRQGPGQGQQSEQMQSMITQRLKEQLGATDEEWTVIGPKVLKVLSLVSSQSNGFQMRSLIGRSNAQGNSQARDGDARSSVSTGDKSLEELQTLLSSEDATTTQIKNKVSEVRKARENAKQDLAKAQKELRELLTLKQEATLISIGLLE